MIVKIKVSYKEIEELYRQYSEVLDKDIVKPDNISWYNYFFEIMVQGMDSKTEEDLIKDNYCYARIVKSKYNIPVKAGYFLTEIEGSEDDGYILCIKDYFHDQPHLYEEEVGSHPEMKEQLNIFKEWQDKLAKEVITMNSVEDILGIKEDIPSSIEDVFGLDKSDKTKETVKEKLIRETRERIKWYRDKKGDNMFDDFYRSHLDFMEECIDVYEDKMRSTP